MTRFWLLRLAPALVATLLVAIPRLAAAAELERTSRTTRLGPTAELCVTAVLARAESRVPFRLLIPNAFVPPEHPRLCLCAISSQPVTPESWIAAACRAAGVQPPARAPPTLSC